MSDSEQISAPPPPPPPASSNADTVVESTETTELPKTAEESQSTEEPAQEPAQEPTQVVSAEQNETTKEAEENNPSEETTSEPAPAVPAHEDFSTNQEQPSNEHELGNHQYEQQELQPYEVDTPPPQNYPSVYDEPLPSPSTPVNCLYVAGFPGGMQAAEIAPVFEKFGEVLRIDIPPPRTIHSTPFGFVQFKDIESAKTCVEALNDTPFELNPEYIVSVQWARSAPHSSGSSPYPSSRSFNGPPRYSSRGGYGSYRGGYSRGYGAPRGGYGSSRSGYGAPRGGYGSYGGGYGAPRGGYGAPRGGYGGPPPRGGPRGGFSRGESGYSPYGRSRPSNPRGPIEPYR